MSGIKLQLPNPSGSLEEVNQIDLESKVSGSENALLVQVAHSEKVRETAGKQIMSPSDSVTFGVKPQASGSVTQKSCDMHFANRGEEDAWVITSGSSILKGTPLSPGDVFTEKNVRADSIQFEVYFPSSNGIGTNAGTLDGQDMLVIRFMEESY